MFTRKQVAVAVAIAAVWFWVLLPLVEFAARVA